MVRVTYLNMVGGSCSGNAGNGRSRDLTQPLPGRNRTRRSRGERAAEIGDRLEIVDRTELVDVRQHRADAFGLRLEAVEAQQRIEPDQVPRRAVQAIDLERQLVVRIPL